MSTLQMFQEQKILRNGCISYRSYSLQVMVQLMHWPYLWLTDLLNSALKI